MADIEKLVDEIAGLSLLEASQLKEALEEKLGVTAAAPMMGGFAMPAAGAVAAGGAAEAAVDDDKTEFNVVLKDFGAKKIDVIKVVRKLTELGLKEAKDLVEGAPSTIMELVPKETAEGAKAELEGAGAAVELT